MKLLVINGVNLNMLGMREPEIYGNSTLSDLKNQINSFCSDKNIEVSFYQSNIEGEIVNKIHEAMGIYDGIIMNPGAFTHYSYALHDALTSVTVPCVEVHISNINKREQFRKNSVTAPACIGQITGFGFFGYIIAVEALANYLNNLK